MRLVQSVELAMKYLMVVIIALIIPATAVAKNPCKEDRQKFCKHAAHVGACLDEHKAELSEACKAKREGRAAKMGKEEGTHAQPGAQPLTKKACETAGMKWNDRSNVCGG